MKLTLRRHPTLIHPSPVSLMFLVLIALQGCAHKSKKQPEMSESIKTHIDSDDIKKFNYHLSAESDRDGSQRKRGRGGDERGGPGGEQRGRGGADHEKRDSDGGSKREEKLRQQADKQLQQILLNMGYCREGYHVVEESYSKRGAAIMGECIEPANDQDKEKFKNTRPIPVVLEEDLSSFGKAN